MPWAMSAPWSMAKHHFRSRQPVPLNVEDSRTLGSPDPSSATTPCRVPNFPLPHSMAGSSLWSNSGCSGSPSAGTRPSVSAHLFVSSQWQDGREVEGLVNADWTEL